MLRKMCARFGPRGRGMDCSSTRQRNRRATGDCPADFRFLPHGLLTRGRLARDDRDMAETEVTGLLTVQQAVRIIDEVPVYPVVVGVPLDRTAGLRLAQDVVADRDYPPFEKSLMDGYAVRSVDVVGGRAELRVVGTIAAGQASHRSIAHGETMAIMTGAPMPGNADGVVPVEDVAARVAVGSPVKILRAAAPHRYVAARGSDCQVGKKVLSTGTLIGPPQIAVMASVGVSEVQCFARPRVAILGTGDELVAIDQKPGVSQIRDSNTHMLAALLTRMGCEVVDISTSPDDPEMIRRAITRGLSYDALFIAGGMSMGEFDHVPQIMTELGVDLKITKLRIKPGKPFVFGVYAEKRMAEETVETVQDAGTRGHGDAENVEAEGAADLEGQS